MKFFILLSLTLLFQSAQAKSNPNVYTSPMRTWSTNHKTGALESKVVKLKLMSLVKCDAVNETTKNVPVFFDDIRYLSISKELKNKLNYDKEKRSLKITFFDSDYIEIYTFSTSQYELLEPESNISIGLSLREGTSDYIGSLSWDIENQVGRINQKGIDSVLLSNCTFVDNSRSY